MGAGYGAFSLAAYVLGQYPFTKGVDQNPAQRWVRVQSKGVYITPMRL